MMTAEQKALQSQRAKEMWAKRKAAKESPPEAGRMDDQAIKEAMAKVPMNAVVEPAKVDRWTGEPLPDVNELRKKMTENRKYKLEHPGSIDVDIDWQNIPMIDGQKFYAELKSEFEKAGRILNARSMEATSGYQCFMCKIHFSGRPKFSDHSYVNPATGLSPRVDCCGELCVINYNAMRINQRHDRDVARAAEERR